MAKVLTFSRVFPAYHPRKGEVTNFVEKIYNSLKIDFHNRGWVGLLNDINDKEIHSLQMLAGFVFGGIDYKETAIKHHTIRAGNRFKVGDKFSPRVWSGKPYASKQIIIAPDIEVKKVWKIDMDWMEKIYIDGRFVGVMGAQVSCNLAANDGLHKDDFSAWFLLAKGFPKHPHDDLFSGQIICWNENINY